MATNWRAEKQARERREAIIDAIETYLDEHGYPPTKVELAHILGMSDQTVGRHIKALVEDGRLIDDGGPRALRLA